MSRVDLHMHTFYSDGRASPSELVQAVRARGISTFAITDHETTEGAREIRDQAHDLTLIPGIELTSYWEGYTGHGGGPDIDILGYFINLDSEKLRQTEAQLFEAQKARAEQVCLEMTRLGGSGTLADVLETNPNFPGYLAIYRTIDRLNPGIFQRASMAQHFDLAWQRAGPALLSIAEAIELVHELGGVSVLAHPSIIHRESDGELLSERGVMALKKMGLDAVEVYHYRLNLQQRRHFMMIAQMLKLEVSGGSDEHGWPSGFPRLGQEAIGQEIIHRLEVAHQARHGKEA
jgi:predicted metal-dependent phosphoesterase TrpH